MNLVSFDNPVYNTFDGQLDKKSGLFQETRFVGMQIAAGAVWTDIEFTRYVWITGIYFNGPSGVPEIEWPQTVFDPSIITSGAFITNVHAGLNRAGNLLFPMSIYPVHLKKIRARFNGSTSNNLMYIYYV